MTTLFEHIEGLHELNWNYYAFSRNNRTLQKPFVSTISTVDFIEQYFTKGGKKNAMEDFELGTFGRQRADHTVSIYFLGLLLFYGTKIKERVFFDGDTSELYEFFQFIWFVTCLSHDTAFYKEHDQGLYKSCPTIAALKKHLSIDHDLSKLKVQRVPQDMFALCETYYSFRHKHSQFKATDHGIYAGMLMYDRLVKNRIRKKAEGDNALFWGDNLDPQYAYAAATVAVHNMWLPHEKDYLLYEKHGLRDLIGRTAIKFDEAPLLFLLGLVDTIDPVKAYPCVSPEFVLRHVHLTFKEKQQFTITISEPLNFEIMSAKAIYLRDWLFIETRISERSITFILED